MPVDPDARERLQRWLERKKSFKLPESKPTLLPSHFGGPEITVEIRLTAPDVAGLERALRMLRSEICFPSSLALGQTQSSMIDPLLKTRISWKRL